MKKPPPPPLPPAPGFGAPPPAPPPAAPPGATPAAPAAAAAGAAKRDVAEGPVSLASAPCPKNNAGPTRGVSGAMEGVGLAAGAGRAGPNATAGAPEGSTAIAA